MAQKGREDGDTGVRERSREKTEKPRMYKVIFHNDDYTSMEFVVFVLKDVFRHSDAAATRIMLHIHRTGIGVAGIFTREIAETKVEKTMELAREAGYPLQLTMEPE
jgi:ATP-dependent Clp protease adaptor protein ClpS